MWNICSVYFDDCVGGFALRVGKLLEVLLLQEFYANNMIVFGVMILEEVEAFHEIFGETNMGIWYVMQPYLNTALWVRKN